MGYFEERKAELINLLNLIAKEKQSFEHDSKIKVEEFTKEKQVFENYIHVKTEELAKEERRLTKITEGLDELAKQRQIGFPWLAKAYQDLFEFGDKLLIRHFKTRKRPALKAAEEIRHQAHIRREAERELQIAKNLIAYYEDIAPFLTDLKEEVEIPIHNEGYAEYTEEERQDEITQYISREEYRKLPESERNQRALDRFWNRPKSKLMIGKIYERYVGYLYENKGYHTEYKGILDNYEDLGRDLICRKGDEVIVIQCKNWSHFKTIHEKHIFQFFGTVFKFKDENPGKKVRAIFYTSTQLSDLARRFANELGIELREDEKFDKEYPSIKCNIAEASGEKIYHLPIDQQYDRVKIEIDKGESYCSTVQEAEEAGFRRAKRHYFGKV